MNITSNPIGKSQLHQISIVVRKLGVGFTSVEEEEKR